MFTTARKTMCRFDLGPGKRPINFFQARFCSTGGFSLAFTLLDPMPQTIALRLSSLSV